ncbi:MAG TPA: hypothetical protein VNO30_37770 [Kofleriaceae bacterium]|nr:hypothetical protein [Kofleriaceae bacterium]
MELDDLKEAWAAHGAALERSLAINERLLREAMLGKVHSTLAPYLLWRVLEVVLGVVGLLLIGPVLAAHVDEPRYLVAGGAVLAFTAGLTAVCARLLVQTAQLGYDGPVAAIQRAVEHIRLAEYRATKWAVLGGVVIWLPAALVLFEAVTGIPALALVDLPWLLANLAFGAFVLVLGQVWSKRYVERPGLDPRARRLLDALSGRSLRAVARHLAELSQFERDEPSA